MNCGQQQRRSQHCNSVWQAVSSLQLQGQGKRDRNNTSKIHAANLRHWIQMDISGNMVITPVGATTEHRVTIPCQDIRVQPPERIRWEEAQNIIQNYIQGMGVQERHRSEEPVDTRSGAKMTQQIKRGKPSRSFWQESSERSGSNQGHQNRKAVGQQPT